MTIRELQRLLQVYDEDREVFIQSEDGIHILEDCFEDQEGDPVLVSDDLWDEDESEQLADPVS
jgi:hypothetical protein